MCGHSDECQACLTYRKCQLYTEGFEDGSAGHFPRKRTNYNDVFNPYSRGYNDGMHQLVIERRNARAYEHLRRVGGSLHTRVRNSQ